jgi:hypothetical protein
MSPLPESFLKLCLHRFLVRFLDEKFGAKLTEFRELDLAGTVLKRRYGYFPDCA